MYVNGRAVEEDKGALEASIREGLTVVGVAAVADGAKPGVRVRIAGHPETDGRWRATATPADKWLALDFDDRAWQMAADAQGFMWAPGPGASQVRFRQIVLWSRTHDGPLPCLQPRVRQWGFSKHSMRRCS